MAAISLANAHHHAHTSLHPPAPRIPTAEETFQLKGRISALVAQGPPLLKKEWVQDKRKFQAAQNGLQRVKDRSAKVTLVVTTLSHQLAFFLCSLSLKMTPSLDLTPPIDIPCLTLSLSPTHSLQHTLFNPSSLTHPL